MSSFNHNSLDVRSFKNGNLKLKFKSQLRRNKEGVMWPYPWVVVESKPKEINSHQQRDTVTHVFAVHVHWITSKHDRDRGNKRIIPEIYNFMSLTRRFCRLINKLSNLKIESQFCCTKFDRVCNRKYLLFVFILRLELSSIFAQHINHSS